MKTKRSLGKSQEKFSNAQIQKNNIKVLLTYFISLIYLNLCISIFFSPFFKTNQVRDLLCLKKIKD